MGNVILKALESWLTTVCYYPFTKKYSNKYCTKLFVGSSIFKDAGTFGFFM